MVQKQIAERIARNPLAQSFFNAWNADGVRSFIGVHGTLSRILVALAYQRNPETYIIIVPTKDRLEVYQEDLELLLGERIVTFPSYDRYFFFDDIQNRDILTSRVQTYQLMLSGKKGIILMEASALLYPVLPPEEAKKWIYSFKVGEESTRDFMLELLMEAGFNREKMVGEAGDISVRGAVIDIFAPTMENPVRLEFEEDSIVSIREFDVDTQRSIGIINEVSFLPLLRDLRSFKGEGLCSHNIFSYFSSNVRAIVEEPILFRRRMNDHIKEMERYRESESSGDGEIFPSLISPESILEDLERYNVVSLSTLPIPDKENINFGSSAPPPIERNMKILKREIAKLSTSPHRYKVYILCDNKGQVDRLRDILEEDEQIDVPIIEVGSFHEGFIFPGAGTVVFTDHEIFHRIRWRRGRFKPRNLQKLLADRSLACGDLIVHEDHGIGRFIGLKKIKVGASEQECLKIAYQDNDLLFLHLDKLHRIDKYSAQEGITLTLNKLGTTDWERLKARTKRSIKNIAKELIQLYAVRKVNKGHQCSLDTTWQKELEVAFEFEETPDQLRATNEIKEDMERARPMDRLVCGDVGYGKTEVAMRAAFKAAADYKQVALLVPTTILAQQHYETFHARLQPFPMRVEVLSRFRTRKEQAEIVKDIKDGKVEIVIGTHRLLSKDVQFKDLGLIIVDEEHRFGVRHKERLKQLKKDVDVLTLTATPIPRTLSMSLMGVRDFSIIDTAPKNRLPIITEIVQFRTDIIRNAIMREIDRGGQVYLVHNRVRTIEGIAARLSRMVPGIRIGIAHGQMREKELENVMISFLRREFDVLVSTMIIESGLDIPNVNTIIINNAEHFGLAQLYQLRGRVGRSSVQAYAYLVVHEFETLDETSIKRLHTIVHHTELGSGLKIAMSDLEIRGAGNLLGKEQSGFINAVGFDLYNKILDQAVEELWNEEGIEGVSPVRRGPEPGDVKVKTDLNAFFPEEYLPDDAERVNLYRQLINLKSTKQVDKFRQDLEDRFGKLPSPAKNLLDIIVLKILACNLGIVSLSLYKTTLRLDFAVENNQEQLPDSLRCFLEVIPYKFHLYHKKELGIEVKFPDKGNGSAGLRCTRELVELVNEKANNNDSK